MQEWTSERETSFMRRKKKEINSSISHYALSLFNFFIHILYHTLYCHKLIFRYYSNIYYTLTKEQNLITWR